jgi:hypothetical protein
MGAAASVEVTGEIDKLKAEGKSAEEIYAALDAGGKLTGELAGKTVAELEALLAAGGAGGSAAEEDGPPKIELPEGGSYKSAEEIAAACVAAGVTGTVNLGQNTADEDMPVSSPSGCVADDGRLFTRPCAHPPWATRVRAGNSRRRMSTSTKIRVRPKRVVRRLRTLDLNMIMLDTDEGLSNVLRVHLTRLIAYAESADTTLQVCLPRCKESRTAQLCLPR